MTNTNFTLLNVGWKMVIWPLEYYMSLLGFGKFDNKIYTS